MDEEHRQLITTKIKKFVCVNIYNTEGAGGEGN